MLSQKRIGLCASGLRPTSVDSIPIVVGQDCSTAKRIVSRWVASNFQRYTGIRIWFYDFYLDRQG